MNKTKIEWADYTWNPVTGYKTGCSYCYARRIAARWGQSFEPTFHEDRLKEPQSAAIGARVFVCSMADLFGPWVPSEWINAVLAQVREIEDLTFIFLTKYPENLPRWNPWPANAWVGVTVTDQASAFDAYVWLDEIEAPVAFLSLEPMLGSIHPETLVYADWVIVGGQTGPRSAPVNPEWVKTIVRYCDYIRVPLFLKDNLRWSEKRQEWPRVMGRTKSTANVEEAK